ncbi:MAG: hypothetical protein IJV65_01910, partial [Kiritimatiellae bacterium]|nr:hypothetical protein [Kiritimatiellia bacterium]
DKTGAARKSGSFFKDPGLAAAGRAQPHQWMSGADWRATGRKSSKSAEPGQAKKIIFCEIVLLECCFARIERPATGGGVLRC